MDEISHAIGALEARAVAHEQRTERIEETVDRMDGKLDQLLLHHASQKGARRMRLMIASFLGAAAGLITDWVRH